MRKRCSIQQGEKDNCSSEQSPKKSTVPFFGPPGYRGGKEIRKETGHVRGAFIKMGIFLN